MKLPLRSLFSINPVSITFVTVVLVVLLFTTGTPILDMIELKTYDLRVQSRKSVRPSPAIVMALIDEKSLDSEGRWPWPRSRLARLVEILSQDGAKVIGFDIGFLEPDENSELRLINELSRDAVAFGIKTKQFEDFISVRKSRADNDLALANAFKKSSAAIVLGYFFHMSEDDLEYRLEPSQIDQQLKRISSSKYPLIIYKDQKTKAAFIRAYAPESNLKMLAESAQSAGYYSVKSDRDGVVRWMPLVIQGGEDIFPPLALSCVWCYLDKPQLTVEVAGYGVEGIRMGDRFIPTDESGQLLINYLGPPRTFPHYPITDILHGNVAKGTFKDKIVLVGATAMGTHDLRSTPVSPLYPGVEIHATVMDNILTRNFISKPKWSRIYDLLALVLLGALIGFALPRLSALKGFIFVAGLFILQIIISRFLFVHYRVWLNMVYPLLTLIVTYTGLTVYRYVTEEWERKKIKGAFTHYVAPIVIEQMLKDPDRLKLGGEEKELTVLFSDLEGFTSYSERYKPHEMIGILSDYYEKMTEQVFEHQGTLKEYVADELMAIFGAPLDQPDHAQRACATALAMRDQRKALGVEWASMGRPQLKARTGINSGTMLVGNLGSRYRFAYGALGDQVNLGSRIEGLNKMYKTEILIGENTANLLNGSFILREVDRVRVKGKKLPVRIYELLESCGVKLGDEKDRLLHFYAYGMEDYWQQLWQEALKNFERCLLILPEDGPSRVMAERCQIYLKTPPPEDWDGVFEHLTK